MDTIIFKNGLKKLKEPKYKLIIMLYIIISIIFFFRKYTIYSNSSFKTSETFAVTSIIGYAILSIIVGIVIIFIIGCDFRSFKINPLISKTHLRNKHDEAPKLLNYTNNGKTITLQFISTGIPLEDWEACKAEIESALDMYITSMSPIDGKWIIELSGVNAKNAIPSIIFWDSSLLPKQESLINLGVGVLGDVLADLNTIPHMLIGGSTGSGKSVLLKSIIKQRIQQGDAVAIADFKGGIDYDSFYKENGLFITDIESLKRALISVTNELNTRKNVFEEFGVKNIGEFFENYPYVSMNRIIIAFDEVAEVLDKTGCSSESKKDIQEIEGYVSTIARLGRAFGIHLILATQRPDANILNGQIRNNIDMRICGRADDVLSKIILDNTSASEAIPKNEQGLFITNDGTIFRGYLEEKEDSIW